VFTLPEAYDFVPQLVEHAVAIIVLGQQSLSVRESRLVSLLSVTKTHQHYAFSLQLFSKLKQGMDLPRASAIDFRVRKKTHVFMLRVLLFILAIRSMVLAQHHAETSRRKRRLRNSI